MVNAAVLKIVLLSALAAVAYTSSWVSFDAAALDSRVSKPKADPGVTDVAVPGKVALTDAELVQTHARPLFSQNRRPFVPKPQVVEQPVAQVVEPVVAQPASLPRRLSLLGTNVGGSTPSVLVRNRESEEVRWLRIGEAFDGWILSSASADQVAFICRERQGSDCDYRLTLYSDSGGQ